MIEVINRELLIPREEYNIGTNYDDQTEVRQFHLKRITSGGIDLGNLAFSLDIRYANDATDTALLDKEVTDKDIVLTLTIVNSMLQVPGSVIVQIRALGADGALKWTSYFGALFVEDAINFPASYTGGITEIERLEAEFAEIYASEAERKTAETARETAEAARTTAESGRVTAENGRVAAENARVIAENARVAADGRREQEFRDAIATAESELTEHYDQALDNATETLTENYEQALEDASQTLIGAVEDIKDEALGYANSAALSATDSGISARHSEESAEDARLSAQNAAASENILDFYVDYVVPRFVIANNRLYIRDTATQSFIVANNRLYIQNPA